MFKTKEIRGGMERQYKRPYPIDQEIPTVRELMNNHEHNFIESFPGNSEGLTWITRQKLDFENYRSYIYAMAIYAMTQYNPSCRGAAFQFEHNLRKVRNKIGNKHILLSGPESIAVNYMLEEMKDQSKGSRRFFLESIIKDLERQVVPESAACG